MLNATKLLNTLMAVSVMTFAALPSFAQDDFDDIYYNPDKAKKEKKVTVRNYVPTPDYNGSDAYAGQTFTGVGTPRDVDEYNRRGMFAPVGATGDTITVNADTLGQFLYTQRLERFHNPEVVSGSGDADLMDMYYNQPAQSTSSVNIYLNGSPYWDYYSPYYYSPYYSWNWRWNNPWYWNSWYGPSWSWGWDPYWSWSWGWGPSYYPYPGWGWGWSGPAHRPPFAGGGNHAWRPAGPGATGTHPVGGGSSATGSYRRPGTSTGTWAGNRPGAMGTGSGHYNGGTTTRPGSFGTGTNNNVNRPATSTPTYNNNRGRNNSNRNSNYNNNNNTRRSTPTYNTNRSSGSSNHSSGGSFGRGSSGGGRSSGGSYGGGGGGGRGRR